MDAQEDPSDDVDEDASMTPEEWQAIHSQAAEQVDVLAPEEQIAQAKEIDAQRQREMQEFIDELVAAGDFAAGEEITGGDIAEVVGVFIQSMFGLFDVIFIVLAVTSAYRLASGAASSAAEA